MQRILATVFWLAIAGMSSVANPSCAFSEGHGGPGGDGTSPSHSPGMAAGGGAKIYNSPAAPAGDLEPESSAAQTAIAACGDALRVDIRCIADALDKYATAVRDLLPHLPGPLRGLSNVLSHAARQVRHARTKTEAVAAVKTAIAEVHKTIALLKADDPIVLSAETRAAGFVAETLNVAASKLEKAVGL